MAKQNTKLAEVFHFDLQGKREEKYDFLNQNSIASIQWNKLEPNKPNFFLVKKNFDEIVEYEKGFKVDELFGLYKMGSATGKDEIFVDLTNNSLKQKLILNNINFNENEIKLYNYRLFDKRYFLYNNQLIQRLRVDLQKHFFKDNLALVTTKILSSKSFFHSFISKNISDRCLISNKGQERNYFFPLYLYPETSSQQTLDASTGSASNERTPNLNPEIINKIAEKLGLEFVPEKSSPPVKGGVSEGRGGQERLNNLPYLKTFRKELRNNLTPAEATLWTLLKNSQLDGRKFRRQHSVGNYILDFYCPSEKLAIELDGQGHFEASQAEYDRERDLFLEYYGIKVLRFENKIVWNNPEGLLDEVKRYFGKQPLSQHKADSSPDKVEQLESFAPIDILDYIYAVLHSPTYREKYKEFLKIDFPRVPYPETSSKFRTMTKLGAELRQIHLLESPKVEEYITQYPIDGDNIVTKPRFINSPPLEGCPRDGAVGNVYINETQYFANVPEIAWNFYIGGYQPAQKWLKDRKDRTLEFEDILHYQKIIVALYETNKLMKEIDNIIF